MDDLKERSRLHDFACLEITLRRQIQGHHHQQAGIRIARKTKLKFIKAID
jgi:hypothetical protein